MKHSQGNTSLRLEQTVFLDSPDFNAKACMFRQYAFCILAHRCSTTEEWIKKMWYIYAMEYYLAEKNNDIMKFAGKGIELENVILSEVTQTLKDKHEKCLSKENLEANKEESIGNKTCLPAQKFPVSEAAIA
ncbi:hypothetical protein STEG23_038418, partial [Scotinomys teguina]